MAKTKLRDRWLIYLIRERRDLLGSVEALDEVAAIAAAIEKFKIVEPERQKRLAAQRYK